MEEKIEFEIRGMTCDACAVHVEKALRDVDGVVHAEVPDWKSGRAKLIAAAGVDGESLAEAVETAGYHGEELSRRRITPRQPVKDRERDIDFDLVVIGTGGGGMGAAIRAAELGRRVCIIEAGVIGGTCVNIGCIPSKVLIRAAETYHRARYHPFTGLDIRAQGVDWRTVTGQKDNLVSDLRQNKYIDVLHSYGDSISLVKERARLKPDGTIVLESGRVYRPGKLVIASGAAPKILPLKGIENVEVLNSTSLMALDNKPASLVIIGGRAIALELGQTFARFGTKVTVLQRSERLIPEHEPEIAAALADYLRKEGLSIHTGVTADSIRIEGNDKVITARVDGKREEFRAEEVCMAVGRVPNTSEMGLEEAGVVLDKDGFIKIDEYMQTSNPDIYSTGDVTTLPKLVYVAAAGGSIAAENALKGNHRTLDLTVLPDVIFTDPQVASVGLTELQARKKGYDVKVANLPLAYVPRALAAGDTRGLIKLVADRSSDLLLGAHVLAAEGGEIIQTAALAIKFGLEYGFTVTNLQEMLFPYLVQVEGLKLAAQTFEKDVSRLSCCAG